MIPKVVVTLMILAHFLPRVIAELKTVADSTHLSYSDRNDDTYTTYSNQIETLPYANSSFMLKSQRSNDLDEEVDDLYTTYCHNDAVCSFSCDSGDADGLQYDLTNIYSHHLECAACGVTVTITSGVKFRDNHVQSNWKIGNIVLTSIELDLSGITEIKPNAFSDLAFRNVQTLIITNLQIDVFKNGILTGLSSLQSLRLHSVKPYVFADGFLSAVSSTLTYLTVEGPNDSSPPPMKFDRLTEDTNLAEITTLRIRDNLNDTLTSMSFATLTNIRFLTLSDCQIETFASDTFNSIRKTLKKLHLERNHLKTLHYEVFDMFSKYTILVYLAENPWHCDCHLNPFQMCLKLYPHVFKGDSLHCVSPPHYNNQLVSGVDLCSSPDLRASETTMLPFITPTAFGQQCYDFSKASASNSFLGQTHALSLQPNAIGELIATQRGDIPYSLVLVWFQTHSKNVFVQNTSVVDFNCLRLNTPETVIRDLAVDTAYTFCLMYHNSIELSPLNCGSYYNRSFRQDDTWLTEEYQGIVIGGIVAGMVLSAMLGLSLGFFILCKNPKWVITYGKKIASSKNGNKSNLLDNACVAQKMRTISALDASNYEMAIYQSRFEAAQQQLAKSKNLRASLYYSERMPYTFAPPLPPLNDADLQFTRGPVYFDNLDNRENYYSSLDETYHKRID